jgi:N-carbamoyl-L-amino-acid hydrolase
MGVNTQRLRRDIEANAAFGAIETDEGRGRTVLTGSEADERARDQFVDRLQDAGLNVRIDAIGNIVGRWVPDSADPDRQPVATGSHLDSVPQGGIFDGPLGVYAALEAVRALQESDVEPERAVEVVSFSEEEGGRCGVGLLGSSVAAGLRSPAGALALADDNGNTFETYLERIGYVGDGCIEARKWHAWIELHIEQGTVLEDAGVPIGIVDAIAGITNCQVEIAGKANHAGATAMADRRDALAAASEFVLDIERAASDLARAEGDTAVATVGEFDIEPNARNIIPGRVDLSMDIRDVDHNVMDELVRRSRSSLARLEQVRGVETALDRYRDQKPSSMSDHCVEAVREAAHIADFDYRIMHSAGLHDTANVASVTDTVLVFVPSVDGISHNPREFTPWDDCAAGARVLAGAIARLAS